MKEITRQLKIIELRKALVKAREEYHSFIRVRELKDINASCNLTLTMIRLEGNFLIANDRLASFIGKDSAKNVNVWRDNITGYFEEGDDDI